VVPLNVHFGEQTLRDGVDLSSEEFYRRLVASPKLPTTSQPSVGAFVEAYKELLPGAEAIVSVHISSKLSGTCNSALGAREEVKAVVPVEVVDTQQASLGLGLAALAAARAASAGAGLGRVLEETRRALGQVRFFGVLDTLEYLAKGGRIGKAQAYLGALLQIKPLLTVKDGEVAPLERVRTMARGMQRLVELTREAMPLQELMVIHSTAPDQAQELARQMAPCFPTGPIPVGRFGPVIGTHVGPGALGVALRRALPVREGRAG
jgi:DegV family protein with EDD domain